MAASELGDAPNSHATTEMVHLTLGLHQVNETCVALYSYYYYLSCDLRPILNFAKTGMVYPTNTSAS
jgi:hypothetical protein